MRISIFVPDLRGGGVERVRLLLAREFLAKDHEIDLVLLKKTGVLIDQVPSEVRIIDLQAGRIRQCFFPLVRYLSESRPDAILASMWPLTTLAVLAAMVARFRGRVVVSEHTALTKTPIGMGWSGLMLRSSMRWINWRADAVVGVSKGVVEDLHILGLPKTIGRTIYNPVEISRTEVLPDEWYNHPWMKCHRSRRLISVGSLKNQKDYPTLFLSVKKIVGVGRHVSLLILGAGSLQVDLEEQRQALGLEGFIHFGGFVSDPGPFDRAAGLFVLSSAWEGFGNVIVEAMAAGTPVVSTDCISGPSEILDYGRVGSLVPVGDADALADAIMKSLKVTVDSDMLKERASEFLPGVIAEQYLEILNRKET